VIPSMSTGRATWRSSAPKAFNVSALARLPDAEDGQKGYGAHADQERISKASSTGSSTSNGIPYRPGEGKIAFLNRLTKSGRHFFQPARCVALCAAGGPVGAAMAAFAVSLLSAAVAGDMAATVVLSLIYFVPALCFAWFTSFVYSTTRYGWLRCAER